MTRTITRIFATLAFIPLAATTAHAQSQSLEYITPDDAERLFAAIKAKAEPTQSDSSVGYTVTLSWGLQLDVQLQNCEDKPRAVKCRTLSMIANFGQPDGTNRRDALELANQNNQRDVYGRAFVNSNDQIILRTALIATGNETLLGFAQKFAGWQYHLSRFYLSVYDEAPEEI